MTVNATKAWEEKEEHFGRCREGQWRSAFNKRNKGGEVEKREEKNTAVSSRQEEAEGETE